MYKTKHHINNKQFPVQTESSFVSFYKNFISIKYKILLCSTLSVSFKKRDTAFFEVDKKALLL